MVTMTLAIEVKIKTVMNQSLIMTTTYPTTILSIMTTRVWMCLHPRKFPRETPLLAVFGNNYTRAHISNKKAKTRIFLREMTCEG